ncbi:MAG: pyruvate, phosphate dikinase [Candidatus Altiarchaeota archaeon]|nr:pyruvate, phosphate dikinase [Candidatus Altiarchaeota archaeon]
MSDKYLYSFEEGDKNMKNLLGGKGANLAEMTSLGIPVPPGFVITTDVCKAYYANGRKYPSGFNEQIKEYMKKLEDRMGMKFGDPVNPLLVSVRSGAPVSMPGMMDTILNLGINDKVVEALIKKTGNERFAWDAYRRFIQMFGNVVLKVGHEKFEKILQAQKDNRRVKLDTELDAEDLKKVVKGYKTLIKKETGSDFPENPMKQLQMAVDAVFESWNNPRAIKYREIHEISVDLGTAVNVQSMVFGNMGENSGTGVCFTRNPSTGEKEFYGEYLMNAQGEDVVAGIRTPKHLDDMKKELPKLYKELTDIMTDVEKHYKDMQDMEFTIQEGKLYLLQTRNGKRTAQAAVRIAVELVGEKLIDKDAAILRVEPNQLNQLLHKQIDTKAKVKVIAKGLPASPGAAVGKAVFSAERAEELADEEGEKVVLVRNETSPEDIHGMVVAQGILTAKGGMTSHAAVVARGMGKCCVAGAESIRVDEDKKQFSVGDVIVKEGDLISLNGSTGEVILGEAPTVDPEMKGEFGTLMRWADDVRKLGVRTNAETPRDAKVARDFGAEGIGLARTEHMFFEADRIKSMRQMILAGDEKGRRKALDKLLPLQRGDFEELFEIMDGLDVTIRLLDPPLHEFLPNTDEGVKEVAKEMGVSPEKLKDAIKSLHEINPMLGFRGCRLAIVYPEIAEMQTRAIFEAAANVSKKGVKVRPEVMIPVVAAWQEMKINREIVEKTAKQVLEEKKVNIPIRIGTMIELPRAALTADKIAEHAEFFSFGTNDLTQTTYGFSRDDSGKFIPSYIERGILEKDPFEVVDQDGVGQLIQMSVERGRKTRPDLKIGICGEQGGEPRSVAFCHKAGLTYVSCSPYRVPIARLAAAHAALKEKQSESYSTA